MATITVSSLLTRAAVILQDAGNTRWTQNELLDWLNDGQREVVTFKPNANAVTTSVQLVAGTKQAIPADGMSLIGIVRNMGTNGTTPGTPVRMVNRELMDTQSPNWHNATASATAKHYVYTPVVPKIFYVHPPQPASSQGYVEMVYVAVPANATLSSTITLDDIYANALLAYILFRAYTKDAEYAGSFELGKSYYGQFTTLLSGKVGAETAVSPNAKEGIQ